MTSSPAAALAGSREAVERAAVDTVTEAAARAAASLRGARAPYAYRYASTIAASASAGRPSTRGEVTTVSVRVAGRGRAFRGGASVSQLVWGAEFGATTGDVVRVSTSTGSSRTVRASAFREHAQRVSGSYTRVTTTKTGKQRRVRAKASAAGAERTRITGVRRGGLSQFPTRRRDGWFLTPVLDREEDRLWSDTDAAFMRALDGS